MRTSQLEHDYDSTLSEFGRRVANRWLYATMQKAGKSNFSLNDFYAMYAPEDQSPEGPLPESERARPGDEKLLDVTGWNNLYAPDSGQNFVDAAAKVQGTTRDWIAELNAATSSQCNYLHALVVGRASWDDASQEWQDFEASTNNVDAFVLFVLFEKRWPRVDGDINSLTPNEAYIASELGVKALPNTRSEKNGIA
ncbi:hypothetical protein [Paraburkholderia strydomiana]|uniref:hypothetical protein n=1 Tax=Paraburkholderia strydomiana TaxID=1245417 RepID=UPI0038BC466E